MSDDNNNPESFEFDFDTLGVGEPQASTGDSGFDLDDPIGNDLPPLDDGVSADNPYLNDSPASEEETDKKKKGGWFSKGKKEPKEKPEKTVKPKKEKAEKAAKPPREPKESAPRDWETALCVAFSVFLLASLLMFNLAALLSRTADSTIMQTLCFIGAINLIGLPAASVPYLLYTFPKERTLPNVMLGIAAVAMIGGMMFIVTDFYRYGFMISP
jgi:hypothetical protein